MDLKAQCLKGGQNECFSLLKHTKKLLLLIFCDKTAGIGGHFPTYGGHTDRRMDGQTDMEVEIVI